MINILPTKFGNFFKEITLTLFSKEGTFLLEALFAKEGNEG
ncbi:MAG: hypothetical protein WCL18_02810 [bacterium]